MLLRGSDFKGQASWASAQTLARKHRGADPDGYRAELVRLIDVAATLDAQQANPPRRPRATAESNGLRLSRQTTRTRLPDHARHLTDVFDEPPEHSRAVRQA